MGEKLDLAYYVVDPPEGTDTTDRSPVIMLHGMLDSSSTWQIFAQKIAELTKRKVYCLDARNHGDSPWSSAGLEDDDKCFFDILVDDLKNFMDEHAIKKAILIGHSMGGKTIIKLADTKPEMVEKLIVEDMTPKRLPFAVGACVANTLRLLRYAATLIPPESDDITARKTIAGFLTHVVPKDNIPPNKEALTAFLMKMPIKKDGERYVWKTNLDLLEKIIGIKRQWEADLTGEYSGEALFLFGRTSFIDLENHEAVIKRFFPKAKLVEIENAGHLIHTLHPEAFLEKVLNFINN